MNYFELQDKFELPLFPMRGVCLVRGLGATVWDSEGREYIDCTAGNGVANVGHCNPKVVSALIEQSEKLLTCAGAFHNDTRAELLERLAQIVPITNPRIFLCNSGTEAVEAAIKFARASTKRPEVITAMRGFHGRTYGAMSATFNPKYKKAFAPLVGGFHHLPFNDIEKFEAKLSDQVGAVLLEIIQGEGGVNVASEAYLQRVRELCRVNNILLIIDEVQTGFCRTGRVFACEHYGVEPDILCLAKAMAGGVPIGAVVCGEKVSVQRGTHGTTFGGNPLACAAASAAIDFMLSEDLARHSKQKGAFFMEELSKIDCSKIREIRGKGLIVGVELKEKSTPYLQALVERRILALPAGATVVRFLPPLVISNQQIEQVVSEFAAVLA